MEAKSRNPRSGGRWRRCSCGWGRCPRPAGRQGTWRGNELDTQTPDRAPPARRHGSRGSPPRPRDRARPRGVPRGTATGQRPLARRSPHADPRCASSLCVRLRGTPSLPLWTTSSTEPAHRPRFRFEAEAAASRPEHPAKRLPRPDKPVTRRPSVCAARRKRGSGPDRQPGRDAYASARRCRTRPRRSGSTKPIVRRGNHQDRPGDPDVAVALVRSAAQAAVEAIASSVDGRAGWLGRAGPRRARPPAARLLIWCLRHSGTWLPRVAFELGDERCAPSARCTAPQSASTRCSSEEQSRNAPENQIACRSRGSVSGALGSRP